MEYAKQIASYKSLKDLFDFALTITDKQEAKELFTDYVDYIVQTNKKVNYSEAVQMAHSNFGYFAGYYSREVQLQIQEMFGSVHPIFGTLEPTPEEAFEMGRKSAEK